MVKFETLTKIIIGYLKVQADKDFKNYSEVAKVAKVAKDNVGRNANFLVSIGILEGERGQHKLTSMGTNYAQALDWGRLDEANIILRDLLEDKKLVKDILGFIDIHQPVTEEDVLLQIAKIAGVSNKPRFRTGIKATFDMLVTSGLIKQDKDKNTYSHVRESVTVESKNKRRAAKSELSEISPPSSPFSFSADSSVFQTRLDRQLKEQMKFPIIISITIDENTSEEKLRKLLGIVKEIFQE